MTQATLGGNAPKVVAPAEAREEYPLIECVEHVAMEGMECVDRVIVAPDLGEVLNGGESNIRCWEAKVWDASTCTVCQGLYTHLCGQNKTF